MCYGSEMSHLVHSHIHKCTPLWGQGRFRLLLSPLKDKLCGHLWSLFVASKCHVPWCSANERLEWNSGGIAQDRVTSSLKMRKTQIHKGKPGESITQPCWCQPQDEVVIEWYILPPTQHSSFMFPLFISNLPKLLCFYPPIQLANLLSATVSQIVTILALSLLLSPSYIVAKC